MKKILTILVKIIFYFIGFILFISSFFSLFQGGNIFIGLCSLLFAIGIFPKAYSKLKVSFYKIYPKTSKIKFIFSYIAIIFLGYSISFGIFTSGIASKQKAELEQLEQITKFNISYNIHDSFTTNEFLNIEIYTENIQSLMLNGNKIDLNTKDVYKYPLAFGENYISIVGINGALKKTSSKNIYRETLEEQEKRLKTEQEKAQRQKEQYNLAKKKVFAEKREKEENERKKIINEINSFIGIVDNYKTPELSTIIQLELAVLMFGSYALTVEKYKTHSDDEIKKLALSLEKKISILQSKEFPILREKYINLVDQKMWEFNIDVYSKGSSNGVIEFVGGYFASNKNKLETYSTLKEMLELLRFDRANFKWYEYDENYTYWDVGGIADSKVISSSKE